MASPKFIQHVTRLKSGIVKTFRSVFSIKKNNKKKTDESAACTSCLPIRKICTLFKKSKKKKQTQIDTKETSNDHTYIREVDISMEVYEDQSLPMKEKDIIDTEETRDDLATVMVKTSETEKLQCFLVDEPGNGQTPENGETVGIVPVSSTDQCLPREDIGIDCATDNIETVCILKIDMEDPIEETGKEHTANNIKTVCILKIDMEDPIEETGKEHTANISKTVCISETDMGTAVSSKDNIFHGKEIKKKAKKKNKRQRKKQQRQQVDQPKRDAECSILLTSENVSSIDNADIGEMECNSTKENRETAGISDEDTKVVVSLKGQCEMASFAEIEIEATVPYDHQCSLEEETGNDPTTENVEMANIAEGPVKGVVSCKDECLAIEDIGLDCASKNIEIVCISETATDSSKSQRFPKEETINDGITETSEMVCISDTDMGAWEIKKDLRKKKKERKKQERKKHQRQQVLNVTRHETGNDGLATENSDIVSISHTNLGATVSSKEECFARDQTKKKNKRKKKKQERQQLDHQKSDAECRTFLSSKSTEATVSSIDQRIPRMASSDTWLPECNLTLQSKKILQGKECLEDDIIDTAQRLLKRQFGVDGLQTCLLSNLEFLPVTRRAAQIHFDIQREHWLATCFRNKRVEIMDSVNSHKLTASIKKQIMECYRDVVQDPVGTARQLNVHQQPNEYDCGLYAIANLFEILDNGDPTCRYNENTMRSHLIKCLEKGEITAFPKALKRQN